MDAIAKFEKDQIAQLTEGKNIPDFKAGDTVKVGVRIVEGANERVQYYEGVVIARRSAGVNSSFVVRKISHNEGVERKFMIYSPMIHSIEVVRRGIVRRSKLYYLRGLRGKAARIKEKLDFSKKSKSTASPKKTAKAEEKAPEAPKAEAKSDEKPAKTSAKAPKEDK